jgi:transcriptional regulator with XRE-family HTH domain
MEWVQYVGLFERKQRMDKVMKKKKEKNVHVPEVAKRVRKIRSVLDLTQDVMVEKLGVSVPTFSEVEQGKSNPSFEFLFNIAKEYNVNLYYLLYGDGEMFFDPVNPFYKIRNAEFWKEQDVRHFLSYFENSKIVKYSTLVNFRKTLGSESEVIEKEISEAKAKEGK